MPTRNRSSPNPKKPYTRPQLTELRPAEAKNALGANAIPGDTGADEMLKKLDMHERLTHGGEIQNELKKLYAELGEFSHPTPADNPHEYEPEEIEAFERLREQTRRLENELAEITA